MPVFRAGDGVAPLQDVFPKERQQVRGESDAKRPTFNTPAPLAGWTGTDFDDSSVARALGDTSPRPAASAGD